MAKKVFVILSLPDYDDRSIFGIFDTRRRAENALKREGYRQMPNPDVWAKKGGYYSIEIDEWKTNTWDVGER